MNLYLTRSGRLRRADNTLSFEIFNLTEESVCSEFESESLDSDDPILKHALPVESIDAVYIFGEVTLNSKLVQFLGQKKIPVHFFNYYGNHCNTLLPHAEQLSGDLVIRQAAAYTDPEIRLEICRSLLEATFHNIRSVLQYYRRRNHELDECIEKIKNYQVRLFQETEINALMALEGNVRNLYYKSWKTWLGSGAENFKRVYHPPDNPLNALISFLNSLLYTTCVSELYRTALYPGISYLHSPQTRRFSLALDLVEPFKPLMVDRLVFRLLGNKLIGDHDFREYSNGFLLTDSARKKVLGEWDQVLRQTVHHERLKRSVSYRQLLRLDCYKLINTLLEKKPFTPYRIEY